MPAKLTPKQEAFVRAYIETGNASEAYRKAYGADNTKDSAVHVNASKLLKNTKVALRLAELQSKVAERHEITMDKIIRELALIGFANMLDYIQTSEDGGAYVDLSKLTREQAAAIGEVTSETFVEKTEGEDGEKKVVRRTKFKLSDKRAALVDLGKHLGMFPQKVDGTINHQHHHAVEPVSETSHWLEKLLGNGSNGEAKKPLPH